MKNVKILPREDSRIRVSKIVEELCEPDSYKDVYHRSNHDIPMPSVETLAEIVEQLRTVLFPGFYGNSDLKPKTMRYYIGSAIDRILNSLSEQIKRGSCFNCTEDGKKDCDECEKSSQRITRKFLSKLALIRKMLSMDVSAAFEGDPAAKSGGEAIFCYPSIRALTNYRIAHELRLLGVDIIPRIISEMAHSETGIDIHPGAKIGKSFFIDHGTGTVIGETSVIGNSVRLYQGVTLGAKSFPMDDRGNPIKGIARHPIVEDNVIIYSGATILGRVTIGKDSVIGGNVWLTHSLPPGTKVLQSNVEESYFQNGSGI